MVQCNVHRRHAHGIGGPAANVRGSRVQFVSGRWPFDVAHRREPGPNKTIRDINRDAMGDMRRLSELFDVRLHDGEVPAIFQQMFETICAMYHILNTTEFGTRDELWHVYRRYQFISPTYRLPGLAQMEKENCSAMIQFCSELTVARLQPYFACSPLFYLPTLRNGGPGYSECRADA